MCIEYVMPGLVAAVGLLLGVRILRKKAAKEVSREFRGRNVVIHDTAANYFGLQSKKGKQIRGNGILVMTDEEIYFRMLLPSREMRIPLHRIKSVSHPKSHVGKSVGRKLLRVDFEDDTGRIDGAAWYVRDPEAWARAIATYSPGGG
ncbi:hypothetical protein GF402_11920 [Candidatus Fermentibacteria bacterium]|nr:hypothetical protein [Candidatus Fermentibacteria bacterium]